MFGIKQNIFLLITISVIQLSCQQQQSRGFFIYPGTQPNAQFRRCNAVGNYAFNSIHLFDESNTQGCECLITSRSGDDIDTLRIQEYRNNNWETIEPEINITSDSHTITVYIGETYVLFDNYNYSLPIATQIIGGVGYMYMDCQDATAPPSTTPTSTAAPTTTTPSTTTTTTTPTTTTAMPTTTATTMPTTPTTTTPTTTTTTTTSPTTTVSPTTTTTPITTESTTTESATPTSEAPTTTTTSTTTTTMSRPIPTVGPSITTPSTTSTTPSTTSTTTTIPPPPTTTRTESQTSDSEDSDVTTAESQSLPLSDGGKDDSMVFYVAMAFAVFGVIIIIVTGLAAVIACRSKGSSKEKKMDEEDRYDVIDHDYNDKTIDDSTIQSSNAGVLGNENPSYRPDFEASILAKGSEQHSMGDSGHGGSVHEDLNRVHFATEIREEPAENPPTESYSMEGYDDNQNNADRYQTQVSEENETETPSAQPTQSDNVFSANEEQEAFAMDEIEAIAQEEPQAPNPEPSEALALDDDEPMSPSAEAFNNEFQFPAADEPRAPSPAPYLEPTPANNEEQFAPPMDDESGETFSASAPDFDEGASGPVDDDVTPVAGTSVPPPPPPPPLPNL